MPPLLTIAIPTFRREQYLCELLMSLMLPPELWNEVEVVVSDNASEYDIEAAIQALSLPYPLRLHVNEANIGATQNFINCVSMARGRFVWILGDDELLEPGAVSTVVDRLSRHPDLGLLLLSATNWNCAPPFERRFEDYGTLIREIEVFAPELPLKQTLLSVLIFRRVDFDYELAYRRFYSNYGQTYAMINRAGSRPAMVLSASEPVVYVREVRAVSDQLPPRLVATQVRYLKFLARRFQAPGQRRFARQFVTRYRLDVARDALFRAWKRTLPGTYSFFQERFGRSSR